MKSTTLTESVLTAVYFMALLIFVTGGRLNAVAKSIVVGGGILSGTGLLLSLYRDRMLTLPDRILRREGVFPVLNWHQGGLPFRARPAPGAKRQADGYYSAFGLIVIDNGSIQCLASAL